MKKLIVLIVTFILSSNLVHAKTIHQVEMETINSIQNSLFLLTNSSDLKTFEDIWQAPLYTCTVTVTVGGLTGTGTGFGTTPDEACQNATSNALKNLKFANI